MGEPLTGSWERVYASPESGAAKWGTGINRIHYEYGSPNLRVQGRFGDQPDIHAPGTAIPEFVNNEGWGYVPRNPDVQPHPYMDDRPEWDKTPEDWRAVNKTFHPPWNASGLAKSFFRSLHDGAHRINQKLADSLPSETVSEGWLNKPKGSPADARVSSVEQYERQTSMQQRYQTRVNEHAVMRGTDEPRASIASRVVGQKLKFFSGNERHYDMFPFQQDEKVRPFWYRKAGTDHPSKMEPNAFVVTTPYQRTPAPDPSLGAQEVSISGGTDEYGYTSEDSGYY